MTHQIRIAIDGPAGSGKSTTARDVAKRLGYVFIDSGAMYRAVTLKALENNIDVNDTQKVIEIAEKISIRLLPSDTKTIIFIDGKDRSDDIRRPEVSKNITPVAGNTRVREILVSKQQELGKEGGVVMDGRDIGTVVFPDAQLKVYMRATPEERAQRRMREFKALEGKEILDNEKARYEEVLKDIIARDLGDESRSVGPLKKADDAVEIDTTVLTLETQNQAVYELAVARIKQQ
eukprot:TRINITY_DN1329_c0_g1_i1.p1 TRINITY_DN1329_c0_g1~~TRINITY_DN1329_c0_g1_i1.p1  ORF type:complete len:243 (+),score=120.88 TRINITY_DN1329_c0_g1_i1:28-729(+)